MYILTCKIYDEKYKNDDDYMDFIVVNNDFAKTANKINEIFEKQVKAKYPMIFTKLDKINLDETSITYIVAQLQKYTITKSSHQVISDAFESIISYVSKGSQGQFFTPKNIVDLMVNILKPEKSKILIDPACGTGGFLASTMNYIWGKIDKQNLELITKLEEKRVYAMKQLYGIEKDDFLAKITKTYMAILCDGSPNIFIEDSLNYINWSSNSKSAIKDNSFDYVLTNPPFGKDIKVKNETKSLYKFGNIDILFLEKSLRLLKDGGILGIILPETILHSPNNKAIREELIYKHNIMCLVDLPHNTFRPFNNAKCNIIFIQKNVKQQENILAINIENIGHDHQGSPVYEYDLSTNTFNEERIKDDM